MTEAALLSKEQLDLPRLEVASPKDKPPYCITLETVMAFAGRVKAHVAHCPASNYASAAGEWAQRQADYSKLFRRMRCNSSAERRYNGSHGGIRKAVSSRSTPPPISTVYCANRPMSRWTTLSSSAE